MNVFRGFNAQVLAYMLAISVPLTILLYLLRGFGILSNMPGGVILFFMLVSVISGIMYILEKTKSL